MEELRNAIKKYMALRLTVTTIILLVAVFIIDPGVRIPFIALVGIAYFTGIAYAILVRQKRHLRTLAYLQIIGDVVIITAAVSITQSINSPFTFLYILCIFAASTLFSFKGCAFITTLASGLYSGIIFLEFKRIFNPPPFTGLEGMDALDVFFSVYVKVCAFYMVAFLSTSLVMSQRKRNERMERDLLRADKLSSLGQLSASLIHEIKNPLSAISSSSEYLQKEFNLDIYARRLLEIITQETRRLDQLITQFLNFTRMETERIDVCSLNKILEDTLALIKGPISRNVKLVVHLEPGIKIRGNAEQLKQVFLNLILNGLQAMPQGGELKIDIPSLNRGDSLVRIDISDTGQGIPEEDIPRIFEPFYTTKENGTGLGLAIVRRIIENHKGKIEVVSKMGKGTTFSIYLPLGPESEKGNL